MTDLPAHSKFSASSSHRWMHCPGSMALEAVLPDKPSGYAEEGTAAHTLGAWCLDEGKDAADYPHESITTEAGHTFAVGPMVDHVQTYVDSVRTYGGDLMVEQRVHYGDWLGVSDDEAFGTSDAVIIENDVMLPDLQAQLNTAAAYSEALRGDRITIVDFKFGMGVRVFASTEEEIDGNIVTVGNPQLMLYALGALYEFGFLGDFKRARMVISQPRIGHHDEWECDVAELHAFALEARAAVAKAKAATHPIAPGADGYTALNPSEDACRFCKAKATCPALAAEVRTTTKHSAAADPQDFNDLIVKDASLTGEYTADALAQAMGKVGLIEDWCKAIRAEAERRLFAGQDVPGYKLVEGKRGNRAWTDAAEVEAKLKAMRLRHEDMFSYSLKGPAPMEKLLKKESPRRWAALQEFITQSEGKPSVAPASDGRPALSVTPTADDFDDLSDTVGESNSHPFRS